MEALNRQQLNRTLLQRQGLLERFRIPLSAATSRVGSFQAQHPEWPPVAAWSRMSAMAPSMYEAALARRELVRATLMRITLHTVAARDFWAMSRVMLPARQNQFRLLFKEQAADAAVMRRLRSAHEAALAALADRPHTSAELSAIMARAAPDDAHRPNRYLWRHFAAVVPLVDVPAADGTSRYGRSMYATAEAWLGPRPETDPLDDLALVVERYLRAYGPASTDDLVMWIGRQIGALRPGLERLGDRLTRFRDEAGRELLDLADAPLAPPDAPVACRFLARWDAILLSHATGHRDRIISPDHRKAVYTKNGDVRPTFIVNGFVAGTWDLAESGEVATLMLRPFGKLSSAERRELEAEGMLLAAFVRPAADSHAVEWAGRE